MRRRLAVARMPHIVDKNYEAHGLIWPKTSSQNRIATDQMELNGHGDGRKKRQMVAGKTMGLILDGEVSPTPEEPFLSEEARGSVLKERSQNRVGGTQGEPSSYTLDEKADLNGAEVALFPNGGSEIFMNENGDTAVLEEAAEISESRDTLNKTPPSNSRKDIPGGARVRKLSAAELYKLVSSSPSPLPNLQKDSRDPISPITEQTISLSPRVSSSDSLDRPFIPLPQDGKHERKRSGSGQVFPSVRTDISQLSSSILPKDSSTPLEKPHSVSRTISTPVMRRRQSSNKPPAVNTPSFNHLKANGSVPSPSEPAMKLSKSQKPDQAILSPILPSIPLPPLSIPTYFQLELSSQRPPPLFIHRPASYDTPYEPSGVKLERLINFLLLPPQLEQVLWFGAIACLDAWLYSFTILPLRFLKAMSILLSSWVGNLARETQIIGNFIYAGLGRMWRRRRKVDAAQAQQDGKLIAMDGNSGTEKVRESTELSTLTPNFRFPPISEKATLPTQSGNRKTHLAGGQKSRKPRMLPSSLTPEHKADILKGFLIVFSCIILMYFDASMMYHSIRGQAAIKLYVIYNVLEV